MAVIHPSIVARGARARATATPLRAALAEMDREYLAGAVLLAVVLAIGLCTAADYGITSDEFIFDGYGPKALAWYTSGFADRSQFGYYDTYLYGPWFQILVAAAQSLHLAAPFTVRHALTFLVGWVGLAALIPIGRLAVGRWAGLAALALCLLTGNLYGHLFFTPNDIPFLAAMTWATLAILLMARTSLDAPVPRWPATTAAGMLTGLAIATRFGGLLSQVYLIAAMSLAALECWLNGGRTRALLAIGLRTVSALALGWITAIALWPWLQTGNPLGRFKAAYDYFVTSYVHFAFPHWGERVWSNALPWHYIPGQLLARLPEIFIALLAVAAAFGLWRLMRFVREIAGTGARARWAASARRLAQARPLLIVTLAALGPAVFVVVRGSIIFDGLRHMLFILPPLAVLAAWGLLQLAPLIRRFPFLAAGAAALQAGAAVAAMAALHPLEYVAMNRFAGGTAGAFGRFDLDYWGAAATEAVRRLERQHADTGTEQSLRAPRVMVCINWRESMVRPLLPPGWIVETDPRRADVLIETERWRCGENSGGRVIDRVERSGVTFATTLTAPPRPGRPRLSSAAFSASASPRP